MIEGLALQKKRNSNLEQLESEIERLKIALSESESRYRSLVDNVHLGINLIDKDFKILSTNVPTESYFHKHRSELVGKYCFDTFEKKSEACQHCPAVQAMATGQSHHVDVELIQDDGTHSFARLHALPLFHPDGSVKGFNEVVENMTERKLAEKAMSRSEAFLQCLIKAAPIGLFIIKDRIIQSANQYGLETLGTTESEIVGKTTRIFYEDDEEYKRVGRALFENLPERGIATVETAYKTKNGNIRVSLTAVPIIIDGAYIGLDMVVAQDITAQKQAMAELESHRKKLSDIIDFLPDATMVIDMDKKVIAWNRAMEEMTGILKEEIIGKGDYNYSIPFYGEKRSQLLDLIDAGDQELEARYSYFRRKENLLVAECHAPALYGGEGAFISVTAAPLFDAHGRCVGGIESIRDITEQKKAMERLQESQQRLTDIINFLPDATFVIDQGGKVIAWNKAIAEMTGVSAADMLWKNNYEYALPFYGERRPILIDYVLKPVEEVRTIYANVEKRDSALEGETYIPAFRGSEAHIYGKASVLMDSKGNIVGAIETIRNTTARHKTEEKYRTLYENAVMGIYQATLQGRVISSNPAFAGILGYESPEDVLDNITDIAQLYVNPEERSEFMRQMEDKGIVEGQEINIVRKDGSKGWVVLNARAVKDASGEIIHYEGALQDITERKSLELQLRQAQKMEAIGTLAGGIAHDFNNILTAVIGYAELASDEPGTTLRVQGYLKQIFRAGIQASDLVKQILAFSRQSDDKLAPLKISPIVKEVLKLLRATLPSTIEIQKEIDSACPYTVNANATQIHQIIMNLCTNAAHAMHGKGTLKLGLTSIEIKPEDICPADGLTPQRYLKLTVSDTGHGIDAGIRDKIFDPFFTTKKPGEGTGLGLSVVHGIVKRYGGAISVKSEVGKGTEFDVYIPVSTELREQLEQEKDLPVSGGKERILLVDDEEAIVELEKTMLTGLGYEVVCMTSSLKALELFQAKPERFDLVITDMTMPNMTGLELAQELIRHRPNIPIILCTGFSKMVNPGTAKNWGLNEIIMKPIVRNQISASIRRVLDQREQ